MGFAKKELTNAHSASNGNVLNVTFSQPLAEGYGKGSAA
jgi:hypothetical protein